MISRKKNGNRVYYQAKRAHPAFHDLQQAFLKTDALAYSLKQALEPINSQLELAFVFGLLARGNATAESDIDLFLLGDIGLKDVWAAMAEVTDNLKREFNPVIMTPSNYRERLREENCFALN